MSKPSTITACEAIALLSDLASSRTLDILEAVEVDLDYFAMTKGAHGSREWTLWQDDHVGEIATALSQVGSSTAWTDFHESGYLADLEALCETIDLSEL